MILHTKIWAGNTLLKKQGEKCTVLEKTILDSMSLKEPKVIFLQAAEFRGMVKVRFSQKMVICSSYRHTDEPFFVPQFGIWNLPHYYVKETMQKL